MSSLPQNQPNEELVCRSFFKTILKLLFAIETKIQEVESLPGDPNSSKVVDLKPLGTFAEACIKVLMEILVDTLKMDRKRAAELFSDEAAIFDAELQAEFERRAQQHTAELSTSTKSD